MDIMMSKYPYMTSADKIFRDLSCISGKVLSDDEIKQVFKELLFKPNQKQ